MKHATMVLLVSIAGCIQANVIATGAGSGHAAVHRDSVRVFFSEAEAPKQFESIAVIEIESGPILASELSIVRELQKRAGRLGANGIIVGSAKVRGGVVLPDVQSSGRAIAIYADSMPAPEEIIPGAHAVVRFRAPCAQSPSDNATKAGSLNAGERVVVVGVGNGWVTAATEQGTCYVRLRYLTKAR
jgi:hypothetical protein